MPHPPLDRERVARALAAFQLPAPATVHPLGRPRVHASWRLDLPATAPVRSLVLRVATCDPGWDTLETERAAVRLAASEGIPVVARYDLLPEDALGMPAALAPTLPGVPGTDLLADPAVVLAAGSLAAEIGAVDLPWWGTRAVDGRFVAARDSWRAEWQARAERHAAVARCGGTWLGPHADRAVDQVRDDLGALDECERWSLVHGDLHPANVLFVRTGAGLSPSAVLGWGSAFAGDPLAEWARPLELPLPTLARFLDGFGAEEVRSWLDDPSALARLGVYWRTRCLGRLAVAGLAPYLGAGGRDRAVALEVARARLDEAAGEHAVRERLTAALDLERGPVHLFPAPPDPALRARRALESLRFHPRATLPGGALFTSAVAAAELGARSQPGWGELADPLLDRLGPQALAQHRDPIPDRDRWRADLAARVLAAAQGAPCLSLAILHLGLRALDRLEGGVGDGSLRGLEDLVALQLDHEARARLSGPPPARLRLAHAVLGLHARRWLGAAEDPALAEQIRDTTARLAPLVPTGEARGALLASVASAPEGYAPASDEEALLPAVLLALAELGGELPVDPAAALVTLGRTSAG